MRLAVFALFIAIFAIALLLVTAMRPATSTEPAAMVFSHFECYDPSPPGAPPPPPRNVVQLTDQFAVNQTQVGPAVLFCTPVMKKLPPGVRPLPTPPKIDHLECYAITGPPVNRRVLASNQLQRQNLTIDKPQLLCVPTNKKLLP